MSRKTIVLEVDDDAQEELIRRYHALVQEMSDLALSAPEGAVIDMLEEVAVEKGRDTMRTTLERSLQQRIDAAEKKGRRSDSVHAAKSAKIEERVRDNS